MGANVLDFGQIAPTDWLVLPTEMMFCTAAFPLTPRALRIE